MKSIRNVVVGFGLLAVTSCAPGTTPKQVENAVFNDIETACIVDKLVVADVTGSVQQIAVDVQQGCDIAAPFLADLENVINSFFAKAKARLQAKH